MPIITRMPLPNWLFIALLLLFGSQAQGDSRQFIRLHQGEVKVLELKDIEDVAVGDETVLSYAISENQEFILFGKSPGRTDIHVWQRGSRQTHYQVDVLGQSVSGEMELARLLAEGIEGLEVKSGNNRIIFYGTIDAKHEGIFNTILGQFSNPVSLVSFRPFEKRPVVRIDLKLLEVKKRALRDLGIDWDDAIAGPVIGVHKTFDRNDFFRVVREGPNSTGSTNQDILNALPNDKEFYSFAGFTSHIGSVINILEEKGDAEVISAPKLMAKSGEEASFLSGGEFPIPVVNNLGSTDVEFKEFGVRLSIRPTVDEDGVINTFIFTELSSIDFANAVNGVPGVISRNSETTINLRHGETFAISGLALAERSDQSSQLPFLGSIPLLGNLFKTTDTNTDSTELVVIATPYIVTPDGVENTALLGVGEQLESRFEDMKWETSIME